MTTKRFTSEVILESLCYTLYQVTHNGAEVTRDVKTDEDYQVQVDELVEAIQDHIVNLGIDEVMLEDIYWFTQVRKYIKK